MTDLVSAYFSPWVMSHKVVSRKVVSRIEHYKQIAIAKSRVAGHSQTRMSRCLTGTGHLTLFLRLYLGFTWGITHPLLATSFITDASPAARFREAGRVIHHYLGFTSGFTWCITHALLATSWLQVDKNFVRHDSPGYLNPPIFPGDRILQVSVCV